MQTARVHDGAAPVADPSGGAPPLPEHWVERPRLTGLVDAGALRRLTVVTGPPGSGKTSFVSEWAQSRHPEGTLWWSGREIASCAADGARIPWAEGDRWGGVSLLVVDDVDLVTDREIAAELEHLLDALPGPVRAVLIGRHLGELNLTRIGLGRDVSRITEQDLAFTGDEVAAMLAGGDLGIGDATTEQLLDQTEGWAAGLRLLDLTSRQRPLRLLDDGAAPGNPVAEYFEREILSQLGDDEVEILTRTSVAESVTPVLAEEMSQISEAGRVLESMRRRNLFVRSSTDGAFVYHRMFAQHLRSRLALEGREVQRAAHTRLAEWLSSIGDQRAAIRHYVVAGRNDLAVAGAASELTRYLMSGGSGPDCGTLFDDIPEWYLRRDQHHMYLCGIAHLMGSRRRDAARWITCMRTQLSGGGRARDLSRLEFLTAIQASQSMDPEGTLEHFERGRAFLDVSSGMAGTASEPPTPDWLPALDGAVLEALPWIVARARAEIGWTEPAVALLHEYRDLGGVPPGPVAASAAASVALAGGRLGEVLAITDEVLSRAAGDFLPPPALVESCVARAGALLERDELRLAREAVELARSGSDDSGLSAWAGMADVLSARLSLAEGNPRSALRELVALESLCNGAVLSSAAVGTVMHVEMRCYLALGDVGSARRVLDLLPPERRSRADVGRVELSAGRPDRATPHIERALEDATTPRQRIEALLLRARIDLQFGELRKADDIIRRALLLARPEGYLRVFLDEPPYVLDVLGDVQRREPDEFLAGLLERVTRRESVRRVEGLPRMVEALTTRERELIGYLPSHYSQCEIARSLYISSNTVKTHMKGLYRKLGARSRSEAVELARTYGLLPDGELSRREVLARPSGRRAVV